MTEVRCGLLQVEVKKLKDFHHKGTQGKTTKQTMRIICICKSVHQHIFTSAYYPESWQNTKYTRRILNSIEPLG